MPAPIQVSFCTSAELHVQIVVLTHATASSKDQPALFPTLQRLLQYNNLSNVGNKAGWLLDACFKKVLKITSCITVTAAASRAD